MLNVFSSFVVINRIGSSLVMACDCSPCKGPTLNKIFQWAADITSIPMRRGFVYLCAVLAWASRRVLAWQLSTDFCIEAVQEAITRAGTPEIFNTDQGGSVHESGVHGLAAKARHPDQQGRERLLARQRIRGTTLEKHQIREGVSTRLRDRQRSLTGGRALPDVLQPDQAASGA